jgi:hypothetical protein
MGRIGTPLTWKRRAFAVLEPRGMVDRLVALGVTGVVAGPFAVYPQPFGNGYTLMHLPSQVPIVHLMSQGACKHAAEEFAALDMNLVDVHPRGGHRSRPPSYEEPAHPIARGFLGDGGDRPGAGAAKGPLNKA